MGPAGSVPAEGVCPQGIYDLLDLFRGSALELIAASDAVLKGGRWLCWGPFPCSKLKPEGVLNFLNWCPWHERGLLQIQTLQDCQPQRVPGGWQEIPSFLQYQTPVGAQDHRLGDHHLLG